MKRIILLASLAVLSAALTTAGAKNPKKKKKQGAAYVLPKPELKNDGDSTAYLLGISQSEGLKAYMQQQLKVDTAYVGQFVKGIMDRASIDAADKEAHAYQAGLQVGGQVEQMAQSLSKDYYAATPEKTVGARVVAAGIVAGLLGQSELTADSAMARFRPIMEARQKANSEALYGANRAAGEQWLAEIKKKEGVVTLPSGVQYKVLAEGKGAVPTASQRVRVNYEGHLIDGTEFDSSYKRNQPATFGASQVIKGWTEALCRMPVGSKWELYVPYDLAYGERETGKIKPYSALIFTVELLEIVDE